MSNKRQVQIIPPARPPADAYHPNNNVAIPPPRVNPGGPIDSTFKRWEADRHSRTIESLANRTRAETSLFNAQTEAIGSYLNRARAFQELQELPEILANDQECRRINRLERLRQVQHQHQLAEVERAIETTHKKVALIDAHQQLKAQRDFGYANYELAWKKQYCESLDIELDAAYRRELLDEVQRKKHRKAEAPPLDADDIEEALHEARAQLRANGLDTQRIDGVLERRKPRS